MKVWLPLCFLSLTASSCGSPNSPQPDAGPYVSVPDGAARAIPDLMPFDQLQPPDLARTADYDHDGSLAVSISSTMVSNVTRFFTEHIYLPGAPGARPVVVLSPGLAQPAAGYDSYARRLASFGIVTLVRDDPGPTTHTPDVVDDLGYVVSTWLPAQDASPTAVLFGRVDLTRIGLAGHSRGGQASLLASETNLRGHVKAWFGIDPVDSSVLSDGMQARGAVGTVGIPLAILGATVASTCSPVGDDYQVLYGVAVAPAVEITAIGAGHTQFEDPAGCVACGLCSPQGTAVPSTVLSYSVRYLTAFFARELLGDHSVGATFDGAGSGADIAAGLVTITSK